MIHATAHMERYGFAGERAGLLAVDVNSGEELNGLIGGLAYRCGGPGVRGSSPVYPLFGQWWQLQTPTFKSALEVARAAIVNEAVP